ncbi:hypothetical protein GCM10022226_02210 [Sphaerisporangium flaviroseum]|uniref:DUF3631 domain-containing protein n=1 Tax=Sphaerisporangium flaviroseum TaxID=509199 RepID=A0ABP7HD19_9ACTN
MLVDEADTIFGPKADGNEDLRGLLNAGHQRNRPAKRYDAATNRVESIPTFAMTPLAGIGAMPDTIEDRAVVIRMRRRGPGESVAPYRHKRDRPNLRQLAEALAAWLRPDIDTLQEAEPPMPVEDRAADTWEPLIAVADHAGGDWPARARAAVLALTAEADDNSETSTRIRLLTDCRTDPVLPTATLLERLKADPEAGWADYGPAGLTAMKLGALLREYEIRSDTIRFPAPIGQAKGYQRAAFTDAWARYCPAPNSAENDPLVTSGPAEVLPFDRGSLSQDDTGTLAARFNDSGVFEWLRDWRAHEDCCGFRTTDEDYIEAKEIEKEVIIRWGREIREQHGWSRPAFQGDLRESQPIRFTDLERIAGARALRGRYLDGNHEIHSGPLSVVNHADLDNGVLVFDRRHEGKKSIENVGHLIAYSAKPLILSHT